MNHSEELPCTRGCGAGCQGATESFFYYNLSSKIILLCVTENFYTVIVLTKVSALLILYPCTRDVFFRKFRSNSHKSFFQNFVNYIFERELRKKIKGQLL